MITILGGVIARNIFSSFSLPLPYTTTDSSIFGSNNSNSSENEERSMGRITTTTTTTTEWAKLFSILLPKHISFHFNCIFIFYPRCKKRISAQNKINAIKALLWPRMEIISIASSGYFDSFSPFM